MHEVVRERVVERLVYVPHNPISAVELVLSDIDAVQLLLQRLTDRARTEPHTELERVRRRQVRKLAPIVEQLAHALQPPTPPAAAQPPPHPDWIIPEAYEDGWPAIAAAPSQPRQEEHRPNRSKRKRKRKRR
ncbi:hypothetical protein ACIHAX_36685 [Nocardia sp. NPDC051929]|uniref:hypothetical protein n=1 Tax=Nocardia sp. NPDC051929 TaxID=3364327 RepID=UPI0037C50D47